MADPNNIVLHDHRLVFFGPCKTGNTSVRVALAKAVGRPLIGLQREDAWEHRSAAWIAENCSGYLKIGFCRNPYDRFASAYADQIVSRHRWARIGLDVGGGRPNIESVAAAISRIDDTDIDQHWRSLAAEMVVDGFLVPNAIVVIERVEEDWSLVQGAVAERSGLHLPNLGLANATGEKPSLDDAVKNIIAFRYARDFEVFGYTP